MLAEMQMSDIFDSQIHIPSITDLRSLEMVLKDAELFTSSSDRRQAMGMLEQAGFGVEGRLNIGIKKLLSIIEMARQEPEQGAERLVSAIIGLGA